MRDQRVYLNGIDLQSVHPSILLQHIHDNGLRLDVKSADRAGAPGQFMTGWRPQSREITVEFAIRERLDFTVRAQAITAVTAWAAGGGWLELSDRPGLRMYVALTEAPSLGKLREWTADLSMTFTAYEWPFWSESAPVVASDTLTTGSLTVNVTGTWDTRLEAEITPASTALTSVVITVGGETMTLSSLSVAAESTLKIWWDERHLLRITNGSTGLLSHRTGSDLPLAPGSHTVTLTFNTDCDVRLWARGCYL